MAVPPYFSLRAGLYAGIESSAENLIQVLEDLVSERPEPLHPGALDAVIDRFTYKLPAVARVSVIGPDARVLADSRLVVGASADDPGLAPLLEHVDQRQFYVEAEGQRYLRLALTDAALRRELTSEMLLMIALLFPIGALLYAATRRAFVHPLERLAAAGAQFARGEVPPPLVFSGQDELEAVARTFNEMVEVRTSVLRERERQLAEAQAIAHVASWQLDLGTNRVTWSDEAYRMYGVPLGSPVGNDLRLHPEDRARVEAVVAEGVSQRRPVTYEFRIVRPDGEVRHLLAKNVVITDATGAPVRLAGTALDISERKLAEENQQALLRELQTALAEVKTLQGWIRICATCKRVLNDAGVWEQFESYVHTHAGVDFSHGVCPECAKAWSAAAPQGLR